MAIADYLTRLDSLRDQLADNLVEKGVSATQDESLTELIPKVLEITQGGGSGNTPTNLCDNVPYNIWLSGTSIYYNDADYPDCKSYVVPLTPGKVYKIKSTSIGNRERLVTCTNDPRLVTTDTTGTGLRSLRDTTSPTQGAELIFTASSNENYLIIFYSTVNTANIVYEVYKLVES